MASKGAITYHSGVIMLQDSTGTWTRGPTVQEISMDAKAGTKELMGEKAFAEAFGRDNIKITGKFKLGRFNARATNAAFFNQTLTTNATAGRELVSDEPVTVAAGTGTVAAGAAIAEDLGATHPDTGVPLIKVASAPAAGQYAVNLTTGVYTFNVEMNTKAPLITYLKKVPGQVLSIENTLAGEAPTFRLLASNKFQGQTTMIDLPACVSDSFSLAWKNGDFGMPDHSFGVQEHPTLGVGKMYSTVQS